MPSITTAKYARKSFEVDAVQVGTENINDIAKWCDGEVRTNSKDEKYIKVRVHRALNERQTQAFVGDWILYSGTGYKVYTPRAFDSCFELALES